VTITHQFSTLNPSPLRPRPRPPLPPPVPLQVRGELLAAKKRAALRLLGSQTDDGAPLFASSESLPHWVVSACDNDHAVNSNAESALRRLQVYTHDWARPLPWLDWACIDLPLDWTWRGCN
jgi:hypothetical protein